MLTCLTCGNPLKGRQAKFCSRICQNKDINVRHKKYNLQQARGVERKRRLVKLKGGACKKCGYSKNLAALDFHHVSSSDKTFGVDLRQCSNRSWKTLKKEVKKCQLLCHNCHMELHHPDLVV